MEDHNHDWAQIAAWVFGLWSVMIPIGIGMVKSAVRDIVDAQNKFQDVFHAYVLDMERRMTTVEQRMANNHSENHTPGGYNK